MSNPWRDVKRRLEALEDEAGDEPSDADRWRAFVEKHTDTDDEGEAE